MEYKGSLQNGNTKSVDDGRFDCLNESLKNAKLGAYYNKKRIPLIRDGILEKDHVDPVLSGRINNYAGGMETSGVEHGAC